MKINTILQEMEKSTHLIEKNQKKTKEWHKAKDKLLVEILKNILNEKKNL